MTEYIDYCEKCGLAVEFIPFGELDNEDDELYDDVWTTTVLQSQQWHAKVLNQPHPKCNGIVKHSVIE